MRHPSTFENKYSNIFLCKTTGPTVFKFHIEHDLTPGSQNCKIGSDRIWPLLLKIAKTTKSTSSPEPLFLEEFGCGISMEQRYSEL